MSIYEICPHGMQPPYCPQCAGDRLKAGMEAKREAKVARRQAAENERLRATVRKQSAALDSANAMVRNLQRRTQRGP